MHQNKATHVKRQVKTFIVKRGYQESLHDFVPSTLIYADLRNWQESAENDQSEIEVTHKQFDRALRDVAGVNMKVMACEPTGGQRLRVYTGISAPGKDAPAADEATVIDDGTVYTAEVTSFMDLQLPSVKMGDEVYVIMRPMVEDMGLSWVGQYKKIMGTDRFDAKTIAIQTAGGKQQMCCIPLKKFVNWLYSINPERVHPEFRDFIIDQQEKCLDPISRVYTPEMTNFMGKQLLSMKVGDVVYVPMKPIVEGMGLDWKTQQEKFVGVNRHGGMPLSVNTPGGPQQMTCLPLMKLNGWLYSINPDKVHPSLRESVIQYQEECGFALHNYWNKGAAIRKEALTEEVKEQIVEAVENAETVETKEKAGKIGKGWTDAMLEAKYNEFLTGKHNLSGMLALMLEISEIALNERFYTRDDVESFAFDANSLFPYVAKAMQHYPVPLNTEHMMKYRNAFCAAARYFKPLMIKGMIGRLAVDGNLPRF